MHDFDEATKYREFIQWFKEHNYNYYRRYGLYIRVKMNAVDQEDIAKMEEF